MARETLKAAFSRTALRADMAYNQYGWYLTFKGKDAPETVAAETAYKAARAAANVALNAYSAGKAAGIRY